LVEAVTVATFLAERERVALPEEASVAKMSLDPRMRAVLVGSSGCLSPRWLY
jgi:hypothetical protein